MNNEIYEKITDKIYDEITYVEDAYEIINQIDDFYRDGKLTSEQKDHLVIRVDEECMSNGINLGIDDYDWELMKESNPNLSDQ